MIGTEPQRPNLSAADVRTLAIRFADLWAVDPHQMVDEIYAPDIHMESMAKPVPPIIGADELHTVEDRLTKLIPEHRHEIVRVLADGERAFLETTIVAPLTHEYAQAALWWTLDAAGKVSDEIGWFDWNHRSVDSRSSRGDVPPHRSRSRVPDEYEERIRDAARAWARDPRSLIQRCAALCSVDLIGRQGWRGPNAVHDAVEAAVRSVPNATIEVLQVLGDGGVVAALVAITGDRCITRGTVVLTLDADDEVSSVRAYIDWNRADPNINIYERRDLRARSMTMDDLEGRVAVVTGAASGIGHAVAQEFAQQGMRVVLADIDADALGAACDEFRGCGHDVLAVQTDVSHEDDIDRLAAITQQHYGRVDVVHNNAGVVTAGLIEEISTAAWEWVLAVDLWSVIHSACIFAPILKRQGSGHIINTASTAGLQASPGIGPYNVAKFGVVGLSETLRLECEPHEVGVSVLCPGAVDTRIVDAERNRPAHVPASTGTTAATFSRRSGHLLRAEGLSPATVALDVVEAIRANRFWVLTHHGWHDVLAARLEGMRTGTLVRGFGG